MKLTTVATSILVTLVGTVSAAKCYPRSAFAYNYYKVTAFGVDDIPTVCGRLWKYLGRFSCSPSQAHCGGNYGNLQWNFYATKFCNKGMIGSSWWEATGNKFGSFDC
ncbi:hypothetical protein LZ30DRAFT_820110 [Colletotrichum cereale]|nr:hypothetical protein LZ30DRAFT_820110 [Colletotrichum cereale]